MNQKTEAFSIKNKNIIDMAYTFSAMGRVFREGSKKDIKDKLGSSFGLLASVDNKDDFEIIHSDFCEWFIKNVSTAKMSLINKRSQAASYGQAAKVFDVALKVYVYYCNLPDRETAEKLLPLLHGAVDTLMMKNLKKKYPKENIKAETIKAVSKSEYFALQKLVKEHIEDEFDNQILPVQYDDILWDRLNKRA